jgi:cytochrome P450
MGKTAVAEHLRQEHGFRHLDFEHRPTLVYFLGNGEDAFHKRVAEVVDGRRDTVISWGFVPEIQLPFVLQLRSAGFRWVWFDGDRAAAHRRYLALGRSPSAWDAQLSKIEAVIDPRLTELQPQIIDTVESGKYLPLETIAEKLLGR